MAVAARISDHLARPAAGGAAALDHEEALLRADLPHSAAGLAHARALIRAGAAAAAAALARSHRLDGDCFLDSRERLLEAQFEVVAKIGPARGILLRARVHELAEDARKNVGEAVEA